MNNEVGFSFIYQSTVIKVVIGVQQKLEVYQTDQETGILGSTDVFCYGELEIFGREISLQGIKVLAFVVVEVVIEVV